MTDRVILANRTIEIQSLKPEYGVTYNRGYIGFTYDSENIVSEGIAYFTSWDRMSDIKTSHTLIVSGENECIEAHAEGGVRRSDLKKYFDNPHCLIFFRKPIKLENNVEGIIQTASGKVGEAYDFDLIKAHLAVGTVPGNILNRLSGNRLEDFLARQFNHPDRWICSELVAFCLDRQPDYKDRGILARPNETINPQELFEDSVIFEPWHR